MNDLFQKINEIRNRQNAALCTVVSTKGSTPRKTGAKMLVFPDSTIYGTIGGGELEKAVIRNALLQLQKKEPKLFRHDLLHQHGMCCGGTVEIFIEPIMKKNRLYIFGAGHTGQALARFAKDLDFEIVLVDDRKEYLDECREETINKMNLPYPAALQALPFDDSTFICIMTYSHEIDRDILAQCVKKPYAYLGMIGSQRKVEVTRKMFLDAGICSKTEMEHIDMPMGIDIGAEGPDEIAVSILSKLIQIKNVKLKSQTETK